MPKRRRTDNFDIAPELLKISRICLSVFLVFVGFGLLADTNTYELYDPKWIRVVHSALILSALAATYLSKRFQEKIKNLMLFYFYSMGIHSYLLLYWNVLDIGYLVGMVLVVTCVGVSFADRRFLIHYLLFSLITGAFVGIFTENPKIPLSLYFPTIFTPVIVSYLTLSIRISSIEKLEESELKLQDYYTRVSEDLETARATQKSLVTLDFPKIPKLDIHSFYRSFEEVGGDLVSCYVRPSGTVELLFGDISGHGISSAMVSAMSILAFQTAQTRSENPAESLEYLHNTMNPLTSAHHHLSAVYLSYNPAQQVLTYSYAGHPAIYRLTSGGDIQPLEGRGTLILSFIKPRLFNYSLSLESGDRILCFSDGFGELMDEQGNFFGISGMEESIRKNWNLRGTDFLEALAKDCLGFSKGMARDDMTSLLLEIG